MIYNNDNVNEIRLLQEGAGIMHRIIINTVGDYNSIISLYDGIDENGTLVAKIVLPLTATSLEYELDFEIGLVVETTGNPGNFTVTFE